MASDPILSILIVNYNSGQLTLDCLRSIERHARDLPHEVIVADNASADGSADLIEQHPAVRMIRLDDNLGFGTANNRAAAVAKGRYLMLLNNDAELTENAAQTLLSALKDDPSIGVIGPEIRYPDGRFQLSSGPDHTFLSEFMVKHFKTRYSRRIEQGPQVRAVDWISGAAMLMPRELYHRIGGFDEAFFLYMEDADLCRRIRHLGYRVVLHRGSRVIHRLGETTTPIRHRLPPIIKRGQLYYYTRHNTRLSVLMLRAYLYLCYRWNRSLPQDIHAALMDVIRR